MFSTPEKKLKHFARGFIVPRQLLMTWFNLFQWDMIESKRFDIYIKIDILSFMKNINNIVGENIHFILDHSSHAEGYGIVVEDFENNALSVKLTSHLKNSFPAQLSV